MQRPRVYPSHQNKINALNVIRPSLKKIELLRWDMDIKSRYSNWLQQLFFLEQS
jgi:hypothetical protein